MTPSLAKKTYQYKSIKAYVEIGRIKRINLFRNRVTTVLKICWSNFLFHQIQLQDVHLSQTCPLTSLLNEGPRKWQKIKLWKGKGNCCIYILLLREAFRQIFLPLISIGTLSGNEKETTSKQRKYYCCQYHFFIQKEWKSWIIVILFIQYR